MWPFYYFSSQRDYDILKSKSPYVLLYKNYTFSKNETEPKMEKPTHVFRETNFKKQRIKSKTVMSWISWKKKECILWEVYFVWKTFLQHLCFISMHTVLDKLSEYTYFYIPKNITLYTFLLVFKILWGLCEHLRNFLLFKFSATKNPSNYLFTLIFLKKLEGISSVV